MRNLKLVIIMEPEKVEDIRKVKYYNWKEEDFFEVDKLLFKTKKIDKNKFSFGYIQYNGNYVISTIVNTDHRDNWNRICAANIIVSFPMHEDIHIETVKKYLENFEKEYNTKLYFDPEILEEVYKEIKKKGNSKNADKLLKIALTTGGIIIVIAVLYYLFAR